MSPKGAPITMMRGAGTIITTITIMSMMVVTTGHIEQ